MTSHAPLGTGRCSDRAQMLSQTARWRSDMRSRRVLQVKLEDGDWIAGSDVETFRVEADI